MDASKVTKATMKTRYVKLCPTCGNCCKYLSKHLLNVYNMVNSTERRNACHTAQKLKMTKKDLALQIANLPFTNIVLLDIWKMRQDVKRFIKTGVIGNQKLDMLLDMVLKRYD